MKNTYGVRGETCIFIPLPTNILAWQRCVLALFWQAMIIAASFRKQ